jgi:hypothetical protein
MSDPFGCFSYLSRSRFCARFRLLKLIPRAVPYCAENGAAGEDGSGVPVFAEYGLDELRAATDGFAPDRIVSEHGEKAPNVVYRGTLFSSGRTVAIKRFGRSAWPDSRQFVVREIGPCFIRP